MSIAGIRWGRVILFGFLAEIVVLLMFIPIVATSGMEPAQYATPIFSFLGMLLFGYLAARRTEAHHVLHGLLVGVAAIGTYFAMGLIGSMFSGIEIPESAPPPAYLYPLAHALKLVGGAAGGTLAQRQQGRRNANLPSFQR